MFRRISFITSSKAVSVLWCVGGTMTGAQDIMSYGHVTMHLLENGLLCKLRNILQITYRAIILQQ